MIKFTVEAVRYGRSDITLELREDAKTGDQFRCSALQSGVSLSLRFVRTDPMFSEIVEKATTGAVFALSLVENPPQENPPA